MVRHNVDLPEPDGPEHHDDLAAAHVEVDVVEHVQRSPKCLLTACSEIIGTR